MHSRGAIAALALAVLLAGAAGALETDQYSTWRVPLRDATAPLNAKMNYEILRAVETASGSVSGRPPTCDEITRALRRRIDFAILQPIEVWVTHSSLVPRLPSTADEELAYRRSNIYGDFGPLDIGRWVPDSPTVEVEGVRFGTDKISHFVSNGWRYRSKYLRALERGLSETEAEAAAIRWGILEERTGTGLLVDGVFSPGDLEANLAGMRFYLCLCEGPDPMLALDGGEWEMRRRFDWRDFVTPAWDESYNVSIYASFRWKKVKPRLIEHCSLLGDPWVLDQEERYRAAHRASSSDEAIAGLIDDGVLPDQKRFTLESNCAAGSSSRERHAPDRDGDEALAPQMPSPDEDELMAEIAARDADGERRAYVLVGATLTSYEGVSGSLGWLFTKTEPEFDCRRICDLSGATLQFEPGIDGGQMSIGYARVFGETRMHPRLMPKVYLALGMRGVLLHTWSSGELGPSGLSFVGLQGQFTVTSVSFRLGTLWHVGSGEPKQNHAITWSFGWGF